MRIKRLFFLGLFFAAPAVAAFGAFGQALSSGQTAHGDLSLSNITKVVIHTGFGDDLYFDLELADTAGLRAQGLMFRQSLARNGGMLFDFGNPQLVSMWMKNTYIPLDMLFVSPNGRIDKIVQKTRPFSTDPISSELLVRGVIELKGGTVALYRIREGDYVMHDIFEIRPPRQMREKP